MATQEESVRGTVTEALPNTMFRVEFVSGITTGDTLVCYLAGKMRLHRIKVLVGDTVEVLLDPYGGKGRIVRRV
ncbi:MAG: translation initiation factor IF-1 [Candidatus Paceibacterota bacterium]